MVNSEDDEDNAKQRLIHTGSRPIPSTSRLLKFLVLIENINVGKRIILAFQTLGVVFGDVGTSPLYTFSVMFRKAPINGNEDILRALSLVLYTLILIPYMSWWFYGPMMMVKVSLLPNQLPFDACISSFRLKVHPLSLKASVNSSAIVVVASLIARMLYMLTSETEDVHDSTLAAINVNVSLVEDLMGCLLDCDLVPMGSGSDLVPGPAVGVLPLGGGHGIGGSMLVVPCNMSSVSSVGFGAPSALRVSFAFDYFVSGVSPSARFDPYGPLSVPGFDPNRFARILKVKPRCGSELGMGLLLK
ncbi:Potassium transporter 13, partial [Mucuna pruriens]